MARINERMIIAVVPFWMDLSSSIFYLAAPLIVIELGGNPVELGLIGTMTASVHMILANLGGRLSDRLGRRILMVAGPFIFAISCLLTTQAEKVFHILALASLNGVGMAIFWPSFQAWVADSQAGSNLARNIGSFNMSWTASQIIGPTLSGFLFSLNPRVPFWAAAALSFLLFFLLRASVSDQSPQPAKGGTILPLGTEDSDGGMGFLYAIWIANFASWFILGNVRYQFPKLARDMAISPSTIGLLLSCVGLSQFLGFFFLRESDRWHFKKSYLLGAQLLSASALLLIFFFAQKLIFASAFILIGLSVSLTYYSSLYYSVRLLKRKGKGTGLHESILGSGVVLGPVLGGVVALSVGPRAPYVLCLAVLAVAVVMELILTGSRRSPRR
ncbi:MAG: MFS transporter [Thermodesulfobacteriota bacterium]|jgi:DHA1 family multidrug resistance protein-like MFS transporter